MSDESRIIYGADGKPMYDLVTKPHQQQAFIHKPIFGNVMLKRVGFISPIPPRHLNDSNYIHDSRPIAWPVYHPYWVVRMSDDANLMMAYVEDEEQVTQFWPEATEITVFDENLSRYSFNANFQEPGWLKEVHDPSFTVAPRKIGAFRIYDEDDQLHCILGYSDDIDYAVQLNNHKLEYGVHPSIEFQEQYTSWQYLTIEYFQFDTMEEAKARYDELVKFYDTGSVEDGQLPTNFQF